MLIDFNDHVYGCAVNRIQAFYKIATVNVLIIEPKKINSNLEMVLIWNQKRIIDLEWFFNKNGSSIRTVLTKRANLEKLNGCGLQTGQNR